MTDDPDRVEIEARRRQAIASVNMQARACLRQDRALIVDPQPVVDVLDALSQALGELDAQRQEVDRLSDALHDIGAMIAVRLEAGRCQPA